MKPIDTFTEDAKLVQQIKAGDPAAEMQLFEKYRGRLFYFVSRKVKSRQDREDITMTTLTAVILAAREDRIKNPRALSSFLYRIAANKINSYFREVYGNIEGVSLENAGEIQVKNVHHTDPDPSSIVIQAEDVRLLKQACKSLHEQERQIVYLHYYRQWHSEEIAEFLRFSYLEPKTADGVRKTAQRLREKLRKHLGEDFQ